MKPIRHIVLITSLIGVGAGCSSGITSGGDSLPAEMNVLTTLPTSSVPQYAQEIRFHGEFTPSGSTWTVGLDERDVFLAAMESPDWRLGIGLGGHVYSLRGPFGESVPPQRLDSPWNDEVWQMVVTSEETITPIHDFQQLGREQRLSTLPLMYFIHQSGIYIKGQSGGIDSGSVARPFFSPVLRQHWDAEMRTFSVVNWAQQARTPCVWRSGALIFTAYRDLGRGAIEVTQVLHHFGDLTLSHLNAPWGGVRHSALPHTIMSNADGTWGEVEGRWGWGGIPQVDLRDTSGWEAWVTRLDDDTSPALGLVFGTEPELDRTLKTRPSFVRFGTAANVAVRDYQVTAQISKIQLHPGETLAARWFLVVGDFEHVRERSSELSEHAGVWRPAFDPAMLQPIWRDGDSVRSSGRGTSDLALFAQPIPGSVPVFLMEDVRSGEHFVTLDPYALTETLPFANPLPADHPEFERYQNRHVYRQYDSPGVLRDLLGFAFTAEPEAQSTRAEDFVTQGGETLTLWIPNR
jgi:hypothetical protein